MVNTVNYRAAATDSPVLREWSLADPRSTDWELYALAVSYPRQHPLIKALAGDRRSHKHWGPHGLTTTSGGQSRA